MSVNSKVSTSQYSTHAYDIEILKADHAAIKKLKIDYPTSIHGDKIWDASYLLMDYFSSHPPAKQSRVLELGCGWGLAGIYLNKHYGCEVTAVDADADVFPYLQLHAEINGAVITTKKCLFEQLSRQELANYDLIIAADVCFWDPLSDIHKALIDRAVTADVTKIVYADPEREPFIDLAEYCVEQHCAQLELKELSPPLLARGAIMVINNA